MNCSHGAPQSGDASPRFPSHCPHMIKLLNIDIKKIERGEGEGEEIENQKNNNELDIMLFLARALAMAAAPLGPR